MIPKKRDNTRLATIVVPWDESNCCVKVVLFHFTQETFIVDIPIRFPQPRIVDCKVCVMMKCMPTSFARAVPNKHHCRSDSEECTYKAFSIGHTFVWRYGASHEYLRLLDRSLNKYRRNLIAVPYARDELNGTVFA